MTGEQQTFALGPYTPPVHIQFPTRRLWWEWQSPLIPEVLRLASKRWAFLRFERHHVPSIVTSIYSTVDETKSLRRSPVHGQWRGIDFSVMTLNGEPMPWEEEVRRQVCEEFDTGLDEMPRIAPLKHGTAPHAHIQATLAEYGEWIRTYPKELWNGAGPVPK